MKKESRIGLIAAGIAVLAIGGGTLALNQSQKSDVQSVKSKSIEEATDSSKLSALQGDEFDKAFIAEMVEHHAGAVAMANLVDTEAKDPRIQQLALAIIDSQTKEIDDMKSWAEAWNYEYTEPSQHDVDHMTDNLKDKTGETLDAAFLSEMIAHHQSAIDMSLLASTNANHQELVSLAQRIDSAQESEIQLMKEIARTAGYKLTTIEGHNSDGTSDNHGDDRGNSHNMQ